MKDCYRKTNHAEFIFECIESTTDHIIHQEVNYLRKYDSMKAWLDDKFEMPDNLIALLIRFLEQNKGLLSKRAWKKEFEALSDSEIEDIENKYRSIFLD